MKSTIKSLLKRVIGKSIGKYGYTLENALAAQKHVPITSVIDIGASNGSWSKRAMHFFPKAHYLLVEAQKKPHEQKLLQFCQQHYMADFVISAAGSRAGTIYFDESDPLGGQASETPFPTNNIEVPVTTIDHEVSTRQLSGPYLLKLDTHGFELPIFEGAAQTLTETALIVIEVYNFKIAPDSLYFYEMCEFLRKQGFGCLDIFDVMRRPGDQALWQMDMVFAPLSRPEFQKCTYM